jgi:hypothetical protein
MYTIGYDKMDQV